MRIHHSILITGLLLLCITSPLLAYFRTEGQNILDNNGRPFLIKGMGVGGWLVPEGYMWQATGDGHFGSPKEIESRVEKLIGKENAAEFWRQYHENYVTPNDLIEVKSWGFNTIRLVLNYRLLTPEDTPFEYSESGFEYLDTIIKQCEDAGLYVILDMHCAPGGQSGNNIADPEVQWVAGLWQEGSRYSKEINQKRTIELWRTIAERYKNDEWIIGYELLNEIVLPAGATHDDIRDLLIRITDAVREVDTKHIIFVEGDNFAQSIEGLYPLWDNNAVLTFHKYWSPTEKSTIQYFIDISKRYNVPLWMSETGENSNSWYYKAMRVFTDNNIGWAWWCTKKIHTITSPYSVEYSDAFREVVSHFADGRISRKKAMIGLFEMVTNLKTENCDYRPGVIAALFDPEFATISKPYTDNVIPGTIYASDYDIGLDGVAYYDRNSYNNLGLGGEEWNHGWDYRNDGVDINTTHEGNGFKIGWTDTGDWLNYTVTIQQAGSYDMYIRVASQSGNPGMIQFLLDNQIVVNQVKLVSSGGWNAWTWVKAKNVQLPAGRHILKLLFLMGGSDINRIEFYPAGSPGPDVSMGTFILNETFAEGIKDVWEVERWGGNGILTMTYQKALLDINYPGGQPWSIMMVQNNIPVVNGHHYAFTFAAKADAPRYVRIKLGKKAWPYTGYFGEATVLLTPELQRFRYEFVMSEPTDPRSKLEFQCGLSDINVYFDDIQLIDLSEM